MRTIAKDIQLHLVSVVYHIGTLNQGDKRHNSYEGPCLSAALSREDCARWQSIAELGGACFRLNKLGGKFIDIRKTLSDLATMRTIWRWVCEKGYATQGSFYQVEHYDSELGWLHTPFLDRQRAVDEYESLAYEDDQVRLREIEGFLPTHTLREWALWDELPLTCCADFAVLSFGAHCSSLDGGVWQYPSSGVAAPVVGIFPHRVGDWTINIEEY